MTRTRIKICGICRPQDAVFAAAAGADAIGMVFHPASFRCVSLERAEEILAALPPFVTAVGLFVDATTAEIRRVLHRLPLATVQLHGNETPRQAAELAPMPVLKAVRVDARKPESLQPWRTGVAGIVLETASTSAPGGTGIENDWAAIHQLQSSGAFAGFPPLIAAGGLTPENVGLVIRLLRPYAVDVSSGVESAHGEKSPEKIAAFVRAVRQADEEIDSRGGSNQNRK